MVEKGQKGEEHPSVTVFREYLRIKTVQPNPDYESAVTFLQRIAGELDLQFQCVRKDNGEVTVVILSWEGSDPSLPSIMLNSHMDVVPVFPEHWTYEPFSAHKTENGNIYARGSQDMKCVGIQYIEAIRKLKIQGVTLARTLHVTFVPDEEIGGAKGMREFVKLDEFKTMNVGFALDEGLANPTDAFKIYYGERVTWWVKITCRGPPGHASRFIEGSAAEKMCKVVQSIHAFREEQRKRLDSNPELRLGDVTTVNWTVSEGGVQPNVVPSDMSSVFDIRITPTTDIEEFEKMIKRWCEEAGEGVDFELLQGARTWGITSTADDDPWWSVVSSACKKMGLTLEKEIFPAGTDSRFLRELGYPAIGFSPMNNTPILLHDHDEFLNESVFLRGIEIYCEIITALGNRAPFNG
ncbi:aminoacylase-1-like isoform X1 [Acropora muricata]|uniref:aminoacylase-1-like isoform X1 n=1 Tax=Acropora muricata TaxID=159855 RepID=UPI0034E3EF9F